jgi:hypothetical protein
VGRPRGIDRARPLQFDPPAVEILEESCPVADQDGDDVYLHLVQYSAAGTQFRRELSLLARAMGDSGGPGAGRGCSVVFAPSWWWPRRGSGATIHSRLNSTRADDYLETNGSAGKRTPKRRMRSGILLGSISSA